MRMGTVKPTNHSYGRVAGACVAALAVVWTYVGAGVLIHFPYHPDFHNYWVGAETGLTFGWNRLYDLGLQRSLTIAHPGPGLEWIPFMSAPPLAWVVAPLTALPYEAALLTWIALLAAALALTVWVAAPGSGWARAGQLAVALAFYPLSYGLQMGQAVLLVVVGVALCWWLIRQDRPWLAALPLALAAGKPHLVVLVPFALLFTGRLKTLFAAAALGLVLLAASVISLGPDGVRQYLDVLAGGTMGNGDSGYATLMPRAAARVPEAVAAIVALYVAWRHRASVETALAAALVGSVLVQPHLGVFDFSLVLLAGWLLMRSDLQPSRALLLAGLISGEIALGSTAALLVLCSGWLLYAAWREPASVAEALAMQPVPV